MKNYRLGISQQRLYDYLVLRHHSGSGWPANEEIRAHLSMDAAALSDAMKRLRRRGLVRFDGQKYRLTGYAQAVEAEGV